MVSSVQMVRGFSPAGGAILTKGETIISVAHKLFHETIHLMQSSYFLLVGSIETFVGLFTQQTTPSEASKKVGCIFKSFLEWMKSLPERVCSYNIVHGGLMLGTGVCELLLGLQQFDCLTLGASTPLIMGVSNACFFLGNIVMLIHNVNLFQQACKVPEDASEEIKDNAKRVKNSAIISMISALNYIVGITAMFFGGPMALVVMFIALGLTFGGLKILYDWFCPYQEQLLSS